MQLRVVAQSKVTEHSSRGVVATALAELRFSPEEVSRALGLPSGYLRTFIERGLPHTLPADLRRRVACHLGLPEQALL